MFENKFSPSGVMHFIADFKMADFLEVENAEVFDADMEEESISRLKVGPKYSVQITILIMISLKLE